MHLKTYFWEICSPQIHFGKINFEQKDRFGKYTFGNTHTRTYVFTHPRTHVRNAYYACTHAHTHVCTHTYTHTHKCMLALIDKKDDCYTICSSAVGWESGGNFFPTYYVLMILPRKGSSHLKVKRWQKFGNFVNGSCTWDEARKCLAADVVDFFQRKSATAWWINFLYMLINFWQGLNSEGHSFSLLVIKCLCYWLGFFLVVV